MSRILKRPMFRKGGEVMSGIMTGIKPRQNYDNGDLVRAAEEEAAAYKKFAGPTGSDALANLLIQGGLGLVSGEGAGKGTLGSIATAFQKPTAAALDQASRENAFQRQLRLKAIEGQYKFKRDEALARKKEFAKLQQAEAVQGIFNQKLDNINQALKDPQFANVEEGSDLAKAKQNLEKQRDSIKQQAEQAKLKILIPGDSRQDQILDLANSLVKSEVYDTIDEAISAATSVVDQIRSGERKDKAIGGLSQEEEMEPKTEITIPKEEKASVDMSFEKFRNRIPATVPDDIVSLIYYNQSAFADFANIETQNDVVDFNNKYSVQLVLPMGTEAT